MINNPEDQFFYADLDKLGVRRMTEEELKKSIDETYPGGYDAWFKIQCTGMASAIDRIILSRVYKHLKGKPK